MTEIHTGAPQPPGNEARIKALLGVDDPFHDTHPRFSLALDKNVSTDLIVGEEGPRFLVVESDEDHKQTCAKIEAAGIAQLERVGEAEGLAAYSVPANVKPLSNEKLFPDRPSTATYISDQELFAGVGMLWRGIFAATGRLPHDRILAHTGMKDFSDPKGRLFPIPPYGDWDNYASQDVSKVFDASIGRELDGLYPDAEHGDALRRVAVSHFNGE